MGWETHPAKADFSKFAKDWDRLNARFYNSHPYYDSRFIGPLLEYFATGKEHLCIHRTDGIVTGALILKPDGLGRWSTFRPAQTQATALLIGDASLLEALFKTLPGLVWSIEFYAIDPRYSADFFDLELPKIIFAAAHTIGIDPESSFTDYWNKRSKNLKANVRSYFKRSENEFLTPVVICSTDPADMIVGVSRYGELETAGWKSAAGTAVSSDNLQGAFYSEVLRRFALSGQAKVYELRVDSHLAASRLVISNDQMVVILKTAYDENLARIGPGRILLYLLIKEQLESQTGKTIEFYTDATRDQIAWSTFGCNLQNIQVFISDFFAATYTLIKIIQRKLHGANHRRSTSNEDARALRIQTCKSIEDFSLKQYDLHEFAAQDNIELSIDWFEVLQKTVYPDDPGVRYYFVAEDNVPTIILPLRLITKGRVRTIEALGNYYTSLYTPLLTKNSDLLALKQLLATATRDHGGAHVMRFAPMDPESLAYKGLLNELRAIGWIPLRYFCFGNWFLKVTHNWEGYLRKRSANLRSSIKRRSKEFTAAGGTLEVVTSSEGLEQAIADFQEVYSASWKIPEPYTDFVPSLIRRLSTNGMLRLGIAHLQGRAIAAQLWIVGQDKASIYKVAYHKDFGSFSPGTVLTSHLLRHVMEQDHVKEVDFLIGDDEYKPFWMSDRRERWGIVAYNPRTIIGFALFMKEVSGRTIKSAGNKVQEVFLKLPSNGTALPNIWADTRTNNFRLPTTQRDHPMTWTLHPITQFAEYASQWDALVRTRPGTPFLESAFLQPSIDSFGTGKELLCLLQSNGQLRAASIMQPGRRKGIWQTFQPSQLPLGAWITDGKVDLLGVCSDLMGQLPGWTLGIGASQLDPLLQVRPEDSPKLRTLDYIQTAWVDIEGSFETYWEARGKNLKQNTRKQRNKLQTEGTESRIECITSPEEVQKAIEDYGLLESAGWKAADGTAILPDNNQGHFYRKMLENFCALGRGRIYRYWFGEKVVAMDLCIHDQAAIVILKTAYDETYKTISPSTLMRHDQFQQLFAEQKFPRIEFYGKVMEWHTRWTTQSRTIYHATAYRWAWLKQLHARLTSPAEQTPGN